jgi:hypothetical protein
VHEEDTPRNSQHPRTKGAISLGPSGNLQGGFKFMALNTGKKIIRRSWDVIPMPDTVIARVNTLGSDQPKQLIFTDRHGRLIGNTDIDIPGVDFDEDDDAEIPGVDIVEFPGVDMAVQDLEADPAPQIVEIDDLDIPTPDPPPVELETVEQAQAPAAPVESAPVAHNQRIPRGHADPPESGNRQRHILRACPAQDIPMQ